MNVLRYYAQKKGLTQHELSKQFGISISSISMMMNGERLPSLDVACRIERLTSRPKILPRHWIEGVEVDNEQI